MKSPMILNVMAMVTQAVTQLAQDQGLDNVPTSFQIEKPQKSDHGDFSTNAAMVLTKVFGQKPRDLAQAIIDHLKDPEGLLIATNIAGPGFINFKIKDEAWQTSLSSFASLDQVIPNIGQGKRILVELVSANPTGPLHIGNARGGPVGDAIATLLKRIGYQVTTTFYSNDIGGQVDRLGTSLLHWVKEQKKLPSALPEEGYFGEYVQELATRAIQDLKIPATLDDETVWARKLAQYGLKKLNEEIQIDCEAMGITIDEWVYESALRPKVPDVVNRLKKRGVTKEAEGALWFAPQDDCMEDRESVLIRSNGEPTYFADDIVCHEERFQAGYDLVLDVWGSNHHGHIPRVKAALQSLGYKPEKLEAILYQYVRVVRGQEAVKMSKRAGDFVIAREVLDKVGKDAFRFFLLMRAASSHLDFDLDLAMKQSQENPVYYVQYAHARICSILGKADAISQKKPDLGLLELPEEVTLIKLLNDYPGAIQLSAEQRAPHHVVFYLLELARHFQSYYSQAKQDPRYKVLSEDVDRSRAKIYLVDIIKKVLNDGLGVLGVSSPEEMRSEEGHNG
jgi:arginyl-tRNA synthetase